jgi:toxin YoeB
MIYQLNIEDKADKDFKQIIKSGDKATIKRLEKILEELKINPTIGTGNPEQLKHQLSGYWSRRLNSKDRLLYQIIEDKVIVVVVSALGHYE